MAYGMLHILLAVTSVNHSQTNAQRACARQIHASATVTHLADLPQEVRDEMHRLKELFGGMADSDAPILQSDAPSAVEATYAQVRSAQAMLVKDVWFVQYEAAMFSGVRTVSFSRYSDGHYRWNPSHYFGGAACASIQAALAGVTTAPLIR
jgi:hypothetical protein